MKRGNIKDDYILITAALLLLVISGIVVFWFSPQITGHDLKITQNAPKIIGQAVLTVDFGNGRKRAFEGDVVENETIINALVQASKAGNFSYKLDEKNNLAAIGNFARSKNKSWHWYLNGEKIDKTLGEIILKSGDKILIKYE